MPLNLTKVYNQLLDLLMPPSQRRKSLMGIFRRDFINNDNLQFKGKQINPTPMDGEISMDTLFTHLTTQVVDEKTKRREFEIHRSKRLHWVKHHIEERKRDNMLVFSVNEPQGYRTYIYDKDEKYVIVLEPLREKNEYYLLSAFHVRGKDAQRNKYQKKYKRKLDNLL